MKNTYEIILQKKEFCKVIVEAESVKDAVEVAIEKERRGETESSSLLDIECISSCIL